VSNKSDSAATSSKPGSAPNPFPSKPILPAARVKTIAEIEEEELQFVLKLSLEEAQRIEQFNKELNMDDDFDNDKFETEEEFKHEVATLSPRALAAIHSLNAPRDMGSQADFDDYKEDDDEYEYYDGPAKYVETCDVGTQYNVNDFMHTLPKGVVLKESGTQYEYNPNDKVLDIKQYRPFGGIPAPDSPTTAVVPSSNNNSSNSSNVSMQLKIPSTPTTASSTTNRNIDSSSIVEVNTPTAVTSPSSKRLSVSNKSSEQNESYKNLRNQLEANSSGKKPPTFIPPSSDHSSKVSFHGVHRAVVSPKPLMSSKGV
jgi:hypothetical protein